MKFLRLVLPVAALSLPLLSHAESMQGYFKLEDLRRLVSLSDPQISPDGRQIAVVAGHPNWDEDKTDKEIDLVDVKSGALRPLTWKRGGLSSPRWSPDGQSLAFMAEDADTKQTQVFVMPMAGGDPLRLTDSKQGVASYSWSPDGKRIAFYTQDLADEDAAKHHRDALRVTDNHYLTREAVQPWHVWVVSVAGGTATRLTEGSWSVQDDQDDGSPLAWSNDGKSIVYAKFPDPYFGNAYLGDIESVSDDGKSTQVVVNAPGSVAPQYAPKGTALAFVRARDGDQNNGNALYLQSGGSVRDLTQALACDVGDYAWLPDASGLLLRADTGPLTALWRQPLDGKAVKLDLGDISPRGFSLAKSGAVAFVGSTPTHPGELYVLDSLRAKPRLLTHLNDFVDSLKVGKTAVVDWTQDGFKEDGILVYPADYTAGRHYPLVMVIHGGPESASTEGFSPLPQLLAAQGYLVFEPNYRGSTNLGDAYQHAIYRDTGEGPGKDVMAGLDAVEKLGIVDDQRVAISGWSYGGYMTSWLNGRYPDRWKAAVEGAALNDWILDYTISYYQQGDLYFFGGPPFGPDAATAKLWREQSPISLAVNVKAPTLILGDAGDNNVPIVNSYEMFHALQDHGVTTEFYTYPVDTHFPGDIVHSTDVYDRWLKWMAQYLR